MGLARPQRQTVGGGAGHPRRNRKAREGLDGRDRPGPPCAGPKGGLAVAPSAADEERPLRIRAAAEFGGTLTLVVLGPATVAATAGDASLGRLTLVAAAFGAVVA